MMRRKIRCRNGVNTPVQGISNASLPKLAGATKPKRLQIFREEHIHLGTIAVLSAQEFLYRREQIIVGTGPLQCGVGS
jgi:hypothetical protein